MRKYRFWVLALLWLPAGVMTQAAIRFMPRYVSHWDPDMLLQMSIVMIMSLLPVAVCGLPLALGCRKLWRLGHTRAAWVSGFVLGSVTIAASVFAGLLGPIAIGAVAVLLSVPVWLASWWLARRS